MKIEIVYTKNTSFPYVKQVLEVERVTSYEGMLNLYKDTHIGVMPFRCINLNQVAEWRVVEESMMDEVRSNQIETYLTERGDVVAYYRKVNVGQTVGMAFRYSLNDAEQYILRELGLNDPSDRITDADSSEMTNIIKQLKRRASQYADNHPLWKIK